MRRHLTQPSATSTGPEIGEIIMPALPALAGMDTWSAYKHVTILKLDKTYS